MKISDLEILFQDINVLKFFEWDDAWDKHVLVGKEIEKDASDELLMFCIEKLSSVRRNEQLFAINSIYIAGKIDRVSCRRLLEFFSDVDINIRFSMICSFQRRYNCGGREALQSLIVSSSGISFKIICLLVIGYTNFKKRFRF